MWRSPIEQESTTSMKLERVDGNSWGMCSESREGDIVIMHTMKPFRTEVEKKTRRRSIKNEMVEVGKTCKELKWLTQDKSE